MSKKMNREEIKKQLENLQKEKQELIESGLHDNYMRFKKIVKEIKENEDLLNAQI